jgi:hypothetical protein
MLIGYYLARLETQRYVWIGKLSEIMSTTGADVELTSSFCLVHRGKALPYAQPWFHKHLRCIGLSSGSVRGGRFNRD